MSGIDSGIRVGKYEVGRKLGQGGFGLLYVARDHELGREIAIKFLRPEHVFKPTVVQRFLQEARAAARINHPGIVTVFESGIVGGTNTRADGTVFISMELLAGDTLAQRITSQKRLPTTTALNYTRQLASALGAAHQAGIVHRDLKPANVFIVPDAAVVGGERLKVLDFGIAKLADDFGSGVQTHSMLMLGTPMYMSPEQCKSSAKVDARSDIYALGCILFEMLCGKPPFDGDSGELIAKHQLVPPPTPRSLVGEVPVPLDRLITSMLAKSPNDRPQTMGMVEDALAEIDSRTIEGPSLAGDTMPDAAAYAPTTVMPSAIRRRLPLIAGGVGAAMLGIIAGLFTMCGEKKPTAQANAVEEGSSVERKQVVAEVPALADADATADRLASELTLECQQAQADAKWTDLSVCSEKLRRFDPAAAKKFGDTAANELVAEKTLAEIEALMAKNNKESAQKLLEKIPLDSFYRQQAESRIARDTNLPAPGNCDANALKDKGMENVNMGQHAAALVQFEASLRCQDDSYVVALAFMAACNAQNAEKVRQYWGQLTPAMQTKYKVMCIRNHIDPENAAPAPKTTPKTIPAKTTPKTTPKTTTATTTTPPPNCDADELKDKGMSNVNMGQHAAALAQFEASLRCKNDSYVLALAFMAACNSQNAAKAKAYYPKLSPSSQVKYKVMCTRNRIDLGD